MRAGGIVLAGGRSARMGAAKAGLEWHGSTLVHRVAGILTRSVDGPVVVVRAPGQALPRLPAGCEVVEDRTADRGPLEALHRGLDALRGRAEVAFVTATDAPLLHPALVAAILARLTGEDEICAPVRDGVTHHLAGAYRVGVAAAVAELLAGDRLRLGLLLDRCRTRRLEAADLLADRRLAAADPGLESLLNLNGPADYAAARARPAPTISVIFGRSVPGAGRDGERPTVARAATLGALTRAVGIDLRTGIVASVDGARGDDLELPLVPGDVVTFDRPPAADARGGAG
jgi:molybdopterin-guanine dinucleotide biosynthesis protein A